MRHWLKEISYHIADNGEKDEQKTIYGDYLIISSYLGSGPLELTHLNQLIVALYPIVKSYPRRPRLLGPYLVLVSLFQHRGSVVGYQSLTCSESEEF